MLYALNKALKYFLHTLKIMLKVRVLVREVGDIGPKITLVSIVL